MQQADLPKPSLLRRMFAHGDEISMAVTAFLCCAAYLFSMQGGIPDTAFGIFGLILLVLSSLGLGVILGAIFVWQFLWRCGLALLGKSANGDIVEVLKGPYRGWTGKVYALDTWDSRGQLRVDLGESVARDYEDVFSSNEVMIRQKKTGEQNLKTRIRDAEVESRMALALLPVCFAGVLFYKDFGIWGALLAAVLLPSIVFWVCVSAEYEVRAGRQRKAYKRKFIGEDEFRDILKPYMDKMVVQRAHQWTHRHYSSLRFEMSEDRLPEGRERIDLSLNGDWSLRKDGAEVCGSMSLEDDSEKASPVEMMRGAKFEKVDVGDTLVLYFSNGFQVILKPPSSRIPDIRNDYFSFHLPEDKTINLVEGKPTRFELEMPDTVSS